MASMLEIDPNDLDEEHRHMQIVSVLDGMDEEDDNDNCEEEVANTNADEEESEEGEVAAQKMVFSEDSDSKCMFKMLISDNAAGAIIGKAGATIAELQAQSQARIKVSQAADFYPGTNERTVMLSGPVHTVLDAQELIWEKISQFSKPRSAGARQPPSLQESSSGGAVTGKVLVPNEAGGLIIGRAGATIKAIQEQSGARVQISPKEEFDSKISKERVLTLSGPLEACTKCTELIVLKLQEDASVDYQNKSTSYGRSFGMRGGGADGAGGMSGAPQHQQHQQQQLAPGVRLALPLGAETTSATSTITINVPDTIIGYVLGKRGSVIAEIQQLSGAKVVVSPRHPRSAGDEPPAPLPAGEALVRVVTITGPPSAAQMAQFLVTQKLQLANAAQAQGQDGGGPDQRRR